MADALCGPSNALQSFQKQTSADRTLQQDRLTNRHSPAQGFRSAQAHNAGFIDQEFDAFQQGLVGSPQPNLHFQQHQQGLPSQFAQQSAPQAPDWASDFQRLSVAGGQPQSIQRHNAPQASGAGAWHQDFARSQMGGNVAQNAMQQPNVYGRMQGMGMQMGYQGPSFQQLPGLGGMNGTPLSDTAQGKQRAQDAVPQFDEAAFEAAFAQASQDAVVETAAHAGPTQSEMVLEQLGKLGFLEGKLEVLERSESNAEFVEEARANMRAMRDPARTLDRDVQQAFERHMVSANERVMMAFPMVRQQPVGRNNTNPQQQQRHHEPETTQQQQQPPQNQPHNDDEMATAAAQLLDKVSDNTSEKFQNSQFLLLMRRLRDHQVRVEGEHIVESDPSSRAAPATLQPGSTSPLPVFLSKNDVAQQPQPQQDAAPWSSLSSGPPDVDVTAIMNAADLDFGTPAGADMFGAPAHGISPDMRAHERQRSQMEQQAEYEGFGDRPGAYAGGSRIPVFEQDFDFGM